MALTVMFIGESSLVKRVVNAAIQSTKDEPKNELGSYEG
jgi:hypothetical protein